MSTLRDTRLDVRRFADLTKAVSPLETPVYREISKPTGAEQPVQADSPAQSPGNGPSPLQTLSDEQLLQLYRAGDLGSFRKLVERYQRELFHFLVRFTGNRSSAEDVFQETFLQIHQSAANFDTERRFRPWLFTIAANKARDLLRSQHRHATKPLQASLHPGVEESAQLIDFMPAITDVPGDALEREELARRVRSTVMEMPPSLREILFLSYFNQFPYAQISDILGIPLGTVKSRLHTAVADFATRWKTLNKSVRLS
jgi:RNA polymerase sigma-70 factor (ECF subfamily)